MKTLNFTHFAILTGLFFVMAGCAVFGDSPGGATPSNNAAPPPAGNNAAPPAVDNGGPAPANNSGGALSPAASGTTIAPADAKMSTVLAAISRADYPYLTRVCQRGVNMNHVVDKACDAVLDHLKKTKNVTELERICKSPQSTTPSNMLRWSCTASKQLSSGSWDKRLANCATLETDYNALANKYDYNRFPIYVEAMKSAIRCKKWEYFYVTLLREHRGGRGHGSYAYKALKRLHKANIDFMAGLDGYLKKSATPFKTGCHALVNLTFWMTQEKVFEGSCKYLKVMKKLEGCGRASFGRYLIAAKCPKASSFFYDQLLSRDPTTKANACYYLGEYGNKKHIRRMKIISTTDAAYKIRGLTRIYWVRDSCKQAIGRIRLRQ